MNKINVKVSYIFLAVVHCVDCQPLVWSSVYALIGCIALSRLLTQGPLESHAVSLGEGSFALWQRLAAGSFQEQLAPLRSSCRHTAATTQRKQLPHASHNHLVCLAAQTNNRDR